MISSPSLVLLCFYIASLVIAYQRPKYALCGLISFTLIISSVAVLQENRQSLVDAYGASGFAYRWHSIMALIVFSWFLAIWKTKKLYLLIPVAILLLLDVVSMQLSHIDTTFIDPFISAAMIACHVVYISGCIHGGLAQHSGRYSADKSCGKSGRGDNQ